MKTEMTIQPTQGRIAELQQAIFTGVEAWKKAGQLLVEIIEQDGLALGEIAEKADLPLDVLAQLEKIGRNQLVPQLLLSEYPAARKLERLPMSEQERLMLEPVEVMVMKEGQPDTLRVPVRHLTGAQVKQVFASNHVRTLSEQRQWIESQRPQGGEPVKMDMPYVLTRKGSVIFHQGCEMTAKELLRIAAQLQD